MRTSQRRPSLLARLGLPLILLLCVIQSWRPLGAGFDFWAHAAIGRWIANHAEIPKHGLFLWSAPGYPWVYHSWLSQWLFYKLLVTIGPIGIMVLTTAIVCLIYALLWRLWKRRAGGYMPAAAPVLFLVAVLVSTPRFIPRQELFTALLLTWFLLWLSGWQERRADETRNNLRAPLLEKKHLLVVALFALWINLHALVLFPLLLLWAAAIADAVQYRLDRRSKILLFLAVACSAATLFNPWGAGYWAAAGVLKPGSQAAHVQEWWNVWRDWPAMLPFVIGEAILVGAALWSWATNPQRRWAELLWLLGTTALFIRSRRMMWMLAIVCLVVYASNAVSFNSNALWRKWRMRTGQLKNTPPEGERLETQQPVVEQPVVEQPVVEQPVVEQPVVEQPVVEQPVVEQPVVEQPVVTQPVVEPPRDAFDRSPLRRIEKSQGVTPQPVLLRSPAPPPEPARSDVHQTRPQESEMPTGLRFIGHAGILAILLLTVVSFAQVFPQNIREFSPVRGVSSYAPAGAADYILKRRVPPRILSDYEYSSYLHWRLNGENRQGVVTDKGRFPLYIDLFNAYPDAAMMHYLQIMKATPEGLRRLDSLGINTVVLGQPHWSTVRDASGRTTGRPAKIVAFLEKSPAWKPAFRDANARIWVRRRPRPPAPGPSGVY